MARNGKDMVTIKKMEAINMNKFTKTIFSVLCVITLLSLPIIVAHAEETQATPIPQDSQYLNTIQIPSIPPGHTLYKLKLWFESVQETFTFDSAKLLALKQAHIQNRINELKYEITFKNSKHAEELLQKIQVKRMEIEQQIEEVKTKKAGGYIVHKQVNSSMEVSSRTEDYVAEAERQNIAVLTNLLNDTRMPEESRKGLLNAVNRSGMKRELRANMVQGSFDASPKALSLMPFKSAMVYEPTEQKWYSIVVFSDRITISAATLDNPDYYLYPSVSEMNRLSKIIAGINKRGTITSKDKIELTLLWYQIGKREAR